MKTPASADENFLNFAGNLLVFLLNQVKLSNFNLNCKLFGICYAIFT
jgi:hypothetical protein